MEREIELGDVGAHPNRPGPLYVGSGKVLAPIRHLGLSLLAETQDLPRLAALIRDQELDPALTSFLLRSVGAGWRCVELGDGVGYAACLLGRLAWQGAIHAFEASEPDLQRLSDNLRLNDLTWNVHPTLANLGSAPEVAAEGCPTITLDLFWTAALERAQVDLLHVGAHASAAAVLEGAGRLRRAHPGLTVVVDWDPNALRARGIDPSAELAAFARLGLRPARLGAAGEPIESSWAGVRDGGRLHLLLRGAVSEGCADALVCDGL